MKDYFRLQLRLINRKLQDAGVPPLVGYAVLFAAFIGASFFLFYKSKYAPYIYPFAALTFISPLSEIRRNEFLKTCFGDKHHRQIRILENLAIALPFAVFLLYKQQFLIALALPAIAALFALANFNAPLQFTIPTPFGRKPFEFAVGFRNTFYIIALAYILVAIAIAVGNFNLGIFALLLVFAITLSYYAQPEDDYYVWSHNYTPVQFILNKMKTAILYATVLTLPVLIALTIAFYAQAPVLLLFQIAGYVFLCCIIAAKYSAYPNEMSLPQALLLALCIGFPPALIFVFPYFVHRALQRLQLILK